MPGGMDSAANRLIVALDDPDLTWALEMADRVGGRAGMLKVGLELFNSAGPAAIHALRERGARVFYDSKLCDIPNTVAGAAAAIARMGAAMLNVHALGGRAMMAAAKQGAARGAGEAGLETPFVVAVTILTSLDEADLRDQLGMSEAPLEAAKRLAALAREAGLDGVVASAREVAEIKRVCGKDFLTVTPGIRPSWASAGDQARVATPREAIAAGADYLVVGRPITRAEDPLAALERVVDEMGSV